MASRVEPFTSSGLLLDADQADEVIGVVYTGFDSVTVFDGTDNTGKVVLAGGTGPQSILANEAIECEAGVYVEVAGTGQGSLLV